MRTALDVVVPARDEQLLLPRCLWALLWDSGDLELRIIVAANGCADATAVAARRLVPAARELGHELVVLELPLAGKAAALNAASPSTRGCPAVFLDADTVLVPGTLRALAQALGPRAPALLAAPRPLLVRPRTRAARSYAAVWRTLPAVAGDVIGAGCYAVNAAGRARWSAFPDLVADDAFVRSRFAREERRVAGGAFLLELPERRELVRVLSRWRRGNAQLRERFGVAADPSAGARRNAAHLAARPALWRHVPAFAALTAASRLRRPRPSARGAGAAWERADSMRDTNSRWVVDSPRDEADGTTGLPPARPRVHVVLVADDGHDDAHGCLASVRSAVAELTVADGRPGRVAPGELADADYLLVVGTAVRAAPDALDQLLALALRYPAAGVYGGRAGADTARAGSLLLVDRLLWTRLGGLDERSRRSGMDVDLRARARRAGATPMAAPLAPAPPHRRRGHSAPASSGVPASSSRSSPATGRPGPS